MLKNASNQPGANSLTNIAPWNTKKLPQMLVSSKAAFLEKYHMDLRLNATRRSINDSVSIVFDLEAGRFWTGSKMSFPPLTPFSNS